MTLFYSIVCFSKNTVVLKGRGRYATRDCQASGLRTSSLPHAAR